MNEQENLTSGNPENKMGVMPMNKLVLNMSLPLMASMIVQALYNIVDSIFVAKVDNNALTALSYAFPLQTLMISVAGGTGVGISAILSRALGAKDGKRVNAAATNGVFVELLSFLAFVLVGIFAVRPFYEIQTSNTAVVEYGVDYLSIVCILSLGLFMQFTFERILQATGKTFQTMITQGVGAVINIILDPILIFGYCGMPKMGVKGAALATVIGQIVAAVLAIILNLKVNKEVGFSFKGFRPNGRLIGDIYKIGVPSIVMQSIGSVMVYGMNQILNSMEETAVTVFGVYYKLQSFVFMPVFGLNNGIVPIIAYNYGAGKRRRLVKAVKIATAYAVSIMILGFILFQTIPVPLLRLFSATDRMLELGVPALRIIGVHFLLAGFCIALGSVFQALGQAVYSLIVSVLRQLVVLLPAAYLLSLSGDANMVWWSFPIAELMSLVVTTVCFIRVYRRIIRNVPDNA